MVKGDECSSVERWRYDPLRRTRKDAFADKVRERHGHKLPRRQNGQNMERCSETLFPASECPSHDARKKSGCMDACGDSQACFLRPPFSNHMCVPLCASGRCSLRTSLITYPDSACVHAPLILVTTALLVLRRENTSPSFPLGSPSVKEVPIDPKRSVHLNVRHS